MQVDESTKVRILLSYQRNESDVGQPNLSDHFARKVLTQKIRNEGLIVIGVSGGNREFAATIRLDSCLSHALRDRVSAALDSLPK
jgi:hypothetical protein